MTYADFFYDIKGRFMGADVSDIHEHLAFEFDIEDEEAGGSFYVEVKDGTLFVEPYEYYDRDARFICAPDVLVKIAEGEMDPVWAFTTQKLKVEGNIDKALRLKEIIEAKQREMKKAEKKGNHKKDSVGSRASGSGMRRGDRLFLRAHDEARQGEDRAHDQDGGYGLEPVHAAH